MTMIAFLTITSYELFKNIKSAPNNSNMVKMSSKCSRCKTTLNDADKNITIVNSFIFCGNCSLSFEEWLERRN